MNKFNLTFSGEILPGYDLARAKETLAEILALDGPALVEHFFTGKPVILLHDLDRKAAAEGFARLKKVGADVALQKILPESDPKQSATIPEVSKAKKKPEPPPPPKAPPENRGMDHEIREENIGRIDQSWPISKAVNRPPKKVKQTTKTKGASIAGRKPAVDRAPIAQQPDTQDEQLAKELTSVKKTAELRALKQREEKHATEEAEEHRALRQRKEKQAAEEAADQRALKELEENQAAEEAAEHRALEERKEQQAAEEAARLREEQARLKRQEEKRKAAQEKAKRKAEREAKAAEAARLRAEQDERRRAEEEEKAQKRKEQERLAAEKKARLKAEQEEKARLRTQKREEKKRNEEEAKARRLAKIEAKRVAAEEAERIKEEKAEQKRRELELAAELKAEQQKKHAEEFARLKEQKAAEKTRREALERAARERATQEELRIETLKAEQRLLEAEEIARVQAEKMYQLNQQDLATKIPERRSKVRPSKPGHTDMAQRDLPLADAESSATAEGHTQKPDKAVHEPASIPKKDSQAKPLRSPEAPNFFSLKPFRHTSEIRQRALRSAQLKPIAFTASFIATLAVLILSVRYLSLPSPGIANGASAGAVSQQAQLLLVAGDQLLMHDRAGIGSYSVSLAAIGMSAVSAPIAFAGDHELLLRGKPTGPEKPATEDQWQLSRCNLEQPACQRVVLTSAIADVSDLVIDQHSGSLYIADSQSQEIYKTTATGELLARAKVKVPARPRVRLHQGLLYLNSDIAPAISVFRPDEQAFGQQLDEILVIPPPALKAEQSRVRDFLWSADSWWVTLENPESYSSGVYRFDAQWNFLEQIALEENTHPAALLEWADKTLVLDSTRSEIQRFNADGKAEVPLNSNTLNEHLNLQRESRETAAALWRVCLSALVLLALTSFCAGYLHRLRNLVYRQGKERGAEPIADREKEVTWVPSAGSRDLRYKKVTVAYLALGLVAVISAATLTHSTLIVLATGLALAGPLVALFLLYSTRTGHIGLLGTQLLLVDHQNFYHLGSGPRIYYRKYFIMLDDILVFTGSSLLPVFDSKHLRQNIQPLVTAGIKIDRTTLIIKLLQSAHPLVKGSIACLSCLALAILILLAA